jgi:legumain
MMYDDIANNPQNPKKGQLINRPNGPNVYDGVVIDYKTTDVNAANFLNVLAGNKDAMKNIGSGKVIDSNSSDNIFVYYADHGSFGFVGMPSGDYLYAHDLNKTFNDMVAQKRFKKLVFYLEACESGSMFENILPRNENIWAITAANAHQSSYAFYYDNEIRNYLGDEFSVRWMEDSDSEQLDGSFNLEKQYEIVQSAVKKSQVMKFGEGDMSSLPVGEFLLFEKFNSLPNAILSPKAPINIQDVQESVDVRQVEIELLRKRIARSTDSKEIAELKTLLNAELTSRSVTDVLFAKLITAVMGRYVEVKHPYDSPRNFECLKSSVRAFERYCGSLQGYGFKYGRTLSALCDLGYESSAIESGISQICPTTIVL